MIYLYVDIFIVESIMFNPQRAYNDLPPLPPKVDVETRDVLKKCTAARTALAELHVAEQLIPDPSVLIHTIPNLEARASSAIENIVTTNDALFRQASLGDDEATPATKEAARYRTALYEGTEALKSRAAFDQDRRGRVPHDHRH